MNTKILPGALVAALAVGGLLLWWLRDGGAKEAATPAAPPATAAAPGATAPAIPLETPAVGGAAATAPDSNRTPEAPPQPDLTLEPVEAMLELNAVAAGGSIAGDSVENPAGSVDDLLSAKHYGKSRAQLEISLRSVEFVLARQEDPKGLPKDQTLSQEAISALRIEAAWLKEHVY